MTSLEQVGEEVVGQARCPFESGQSNVGLFAGESTVTGSAAFLYQHTHRKIRMWFLLELLINNHSDQ